VFRSVPAGGHVISTYNTRFVFPEVSALQEGALRDAAPMPFVLLWPAEEAAGRPQPRAAPHAAPCRRSPPAQIKVEVGGGGVERASLVFNGAPVRGRAGRRDRGSTSLQSGGL
jgi:hypothetical protein